MKVLQKFKQKYLSVNPAKMLKKIKSKRKKRTKKTKKKKNLGRIKKITVNP
jgi:hypothetical protein